MRRLPIHCLRQPNLNQVTNANDIEADSSTESEEETTNDSVVDELSESSINPGRIVSPTELNSEHITSSVTHWTSRHEEETPSNDLSMPTTIPSGTIRTEETATVPKSLKQNLESNQGLIATVVVVTIVGLIVILATRVYRNRSKQKYMVQAVQMEVFNDHIEGCSTEDRPILYDAL